MVLGLAQISSQMGGEAGADGSGEGSGDWAFSQVKRLKVAQEPDGAPAWIETTAAGDVGGVDGGFVVGGGGGGSRVVVQPDHHGHGEYHGGAY